MLMDEPTNHMDMETIESLQIGLEKYLGTLVFVSHDREFVGSLATRIIELREGGQIADFHGTYDEYLVPGHRGVTDPVLQRGSNYKLKPTLGVGTNLR